MNLTLTQDDPIAQSLVGVIRSGDISGLEELLSDTPGLASARIQGRKGGSRTPLHIVADWPGYFPCGPQTVGLLLRHGADPNARTDPSKPSETPLHWSASSDDLEVAVALIDGGADIEAEGASIGGGPPLDCAVGYGCWHVARLLVERGAKVDRLWHAAALGMIARVKELKAAVPPPAQEQLNEAFWHACHGGQRRMAEYLLSCGADLNTVPSHSGETPLDIAASRDTRRDSLVTWLEEQGAASSV